MNCVTEVVWKDIPEQVEYEEFVDKIIQTCFKVEKIDPTLFYICVTLTNPENIRKYNQKYRNIDRETDVLSFPMFEKEELDHLFNKTKENGLEQVTDKKQQEDENKLENEIIENGLLQDILGDIIISIDRVKQQAEEYGHSFEREFAYMLVHGFYHLRGYDHMLEDEKKVMRQKEENVLGQLNITR